MAWTWTWTAVDRWRLAHHSNLVERRPAPNSLGRFNSCPRRHCRRRPGDHRYRHELVNWKIRARKEIRDVKDLVGKKIAIASRELGLQLALKKASGFNRVKLLSLGSSPTLMSALREGVVDATLFSYPELLIATKEGFTVFANLRQFADLSDTSVVVSRATLKTAAAAEALLPEVTSKPIARVKTTASRLPAPWPDTPGSKTMLLWRRPDSFSIEGAQHELRN